jgi:membrane associated rhomboid family serine protease
MTLPLVILNVCFFLLEQFQPDFLIANFALWPLHSADMGGPPFQIWQVITYSVLHAGWAHLLFNMWGLYLFGREVEAVLGANRLLVLYLASVITAAGAQLLVTAGAGGLPVPTLGASGGVFGLLLAFAMMFPQRRLMLLIPPIPMPAWLFAAGYAVVELTLGLAGSSGVAHFAHLGGMVGSFILLTYWGHGPRRLRRRRF